MSVLDELAAFICQISFENLSEKTVDKTELHILDSIGAMLAGIPSEEARAAYALAKRMAPQDGENMIFLPGFGGSAPLSTAAQLAVIATRMTEVDDIHIPSCTTPGSVVIPAAIIMSLWSGADGKRLYEGILAGYEVMVRFGVSVKGAEIIYHGIWPTYLCAAASIAAAGARILDLNRDQFKNALVIALTLTTGISGRIPTGLSSRLLTLGCAVRNGITAALSAQYGFIGDTSLLEGLFQSASGLDMNTNILMEKLGQPFRMDEVSLKPYCTARQVLSPVEAFRLILNNHSIAPEDINEIRVTVPQQTLQMINHPVVPRSRVLSLISTQYQMALAAFYEEDLFDIHRIKLRDESRIREFIEKAHVSASQEFTSLYPDKWIAQVQVKADGQEYEYEMVEPKGAPDNPMGENEVRQKQERLLKGILSTDQLWELSTEVKTLKESPSLNGFWDQLPAIT